MKKIILTALFLGALSTSNAVENNSTNANDDCHEYACEKVGDYEGNYGDNISLEQYEIIYESYYGLCEGFEDIRNGRI